MKFHILTLFPEMVMNGLNTSVIGRAVENGTIAIETSNIRDFSTDKHRKVDDYPYGGGAGMLMQAQPVYDAYESVCKNIPKDHKKKVIYVTPQGYPFTQRMAEDFAKYDDLIFLCGHYEGIDERVLEEVVTDYVSIGDYVLTGGELASMVMVDAISRLVPGVLHNDNSAETESFHGYLLEYPQYTRPEEWHHKKAPDVLLGGNQKQINEWRLQQSKLRTMERRPDLFHQYRKLQECKETLMKQKLLHIDMIELINRGRAIFLAKDNNDILLQDKVTGIFYHSGENMEFLVNLPQNILLTMKSIVFHQLEFAEQAKSAFGLNTERTEYQAVYTPKEHLPISGLYRADGTPTAEGLVIRSLTEEHVEVIKNVYCPKKDDLEYYNAYIVERIKSGCMFGAFVEDELAGFIGICDDGSIGLFEVFELYRGRKIGKALETYLVNKTLEMGWIPYGGVRAGDEIAAKLQESLGLYLSKTPVVRMFKE